MMRFFSVVFRNGFFLCALLFPWTPLSAQEKTGGLTVSPAFQEVVIEEQDAVGFSVSLSNHTETPVTLRVSAYDFGSLDESGGVAFLGSSDNLEQKYGLASWMHPENDILTIEPGTMEEIRVTIKNPASLSPGGHYGAITFRTDSVLQDGVRDTVSVNQLFSTLVFLKKVGGESYRLELLGSEYKSHPLRFPETIRLRFENSGNVHVVPRGRIIVSDPLGRIVGKGIINEESALILPETVRVYPVRFAMLAQSLVPGRYTVEISSRYDGRDDFTVTSSQFYFIPPLALLGFLFLTAGGWYVAKRRRQTS